MGALRRAAAVAAAGAAAAFAPAALAAPLAVRATLEPATIEFGAPLRTHVAVLFDPAQVRAGSIRVVDDVAPLTALSQARVLRAHDVVAVARTAACIADACLAAPALGRVTVTAVSRSGRVLHASAAWPKLTVRSRVTAADLGRARPPFLADTVPQPVSYRLAPATLERLLVVAAVALALACGALAVFEARSLVRRRRGVVAVDELARALRLVREAEARTPADRRLALGFLARLLDVRDRGLAAAARTLAWSRPEPEPAAVEDLVDDVQRGAAP